MVGHARLSDTHRLHAWHVMCAIWADHGHFHLRTVVAICQIKGSRALGDWVNWLVSEDVVRSKGNGRFTVAVPHDAPPAGRPLAQSFGAVQGQIWRAMRLTRSFSLAELARDASTEDRPVSLDHARAYALGLSACGILSGGSALANGIQVWRLPASADTGPRAPVLVADGAFDLNRGKLAPRADSRRAA